jgi:CubicO group peptidase (beta-lactamase class C family)
VQAEQGEGPGATSALSFCAGRGQTGPMIRLFAACVLVASVPVHAQSDQAALQARHDRALAAGYKALMLCGAIGNADPSGLRRSADSVERWELSGIQAPFDKLLAHLPARIETGADRSLDHVAVSWADDMPPRIARFKGAGQGCAVLPVGTPLASAEAPASVPIDTMTAVDASRPQPAATSGPVAELARTGFAPRYGEGARTTAVLIQGGRRILGEAYAPGFDGNLPQRTWSVAKSIAATLVGAAVQRREIDVAASAGLGDDDADPRRAITIDQALRMASGRYSDTPGNRTDALYFGGSSVEETATGWPLTSAPGTVFRYANNDTLAAVRAIKPGFAAHPPRTFFETLGMTGTVAETDWRGDYVLSSQVWSTPRDLARLGQLYLQRGRWNGEQLIPADWLPYVSRPSGPQPAGEFGYGAGFWLFSRSSGVPADTIAMIGNRGQYVVVVPSRDAVIVRRGEDPAGAQFDIAAFTRDVLAALPR